MQDEWKKIKEKLDQEPVGGPREEDWYAFTEKLPAATSHSALSIWSWVLVGLGGITLAWLIWFAFPEKSGQDEPLIDQAVHHSTEEGNDGYRESEKDAQTNQGLAVDLPTDQATNEHSKSASTESSTDRSGMKEATTAIGGEKAARQTAQSAIDGSKSPVNERQTAVRKPSREGVETVLAEENPGQMIRDELMDGKPTGNTDEQVETPVTDQKGNEPNPEQDRRERLSQDEASISKDSSSAPSGEQKDKIKEEQVKTAAQEIWEAESSASAEDDLLGKQSPFRLAALSWSGQYHYRSGASHWWSSGLNLHLNYDRWRLETGLQYGQARYPWEREVNLGRQLRIDSTLNEIIEQRQEQRTRTYWVVDSFQAGHWETDTFTVQVVDTTYQLKVDTIEVERRQIESQYITQDYQELPILFGYAWQGPKWSLAIKGGLVLNRATYLRLGENAETGSSYGLFSVLRPELSYRFNAHWSVGFGPQWRAVLRENKALTGSKAQWGFDLQLHYRF